jgi:murein DD-endopeptidase MepM/ murein hydrolase activator NlpD
MISKRLLWVLLGVALAAAAFAYASLPASATLRTFEVRMADGSVINVTVDVPSSLPASQVPLPGQLIQEITGAAPTPTTPSIPSLPTPSTGGGSTPPPTSSTQTGTGGGSSHTQSGSSRPSTQKGSRQHHTGSKHHATANNQAQAQVQRRAAKRHARTRQQATPLRNPDGTPTPQNPTFFDALPGPSQSVPNFVIQQFQVPIFLLPIYQAAGIQYGVRWEVLAAINQIETNYGRNLNVSSAGAVGWMQFLPSTWKTWGVDANNDGKKDPYNPVDAIFAAARYLKAAGADSDVRKAIFAYNHASWYVDSVMLRARLLAGYPPDFVGSLTGLTQGRFPVAAHAKYADDPQEQAAAARAKKTSAATHLVQDSAGRTGIDIFSAAGAPVVAVNDGKIKKIGDSKSKGRYIVLQDVYGNQYTYSHLGSVARAYPVPKTDVKPTKSDAQAIKANAPAPEPAPTAPATAGRQPVARPTSPASKKARDVKRPAVKQASAPVPAISVRPRLFAHPSRPSASAFGGLEQMFNSQLAQADGFSTYNDVFAPTLGLNARNATLKQLKAGSQVVAGTLLGRVGKTDARAPHIYFELQPAGKNSPKIDPKPILDGWKLLESTAIYRVSGKNALYSKSDSFSIGQVLLLPKNLLEKRVLSDPRVQIYSGGQNDIRTGQIDRRVLATLEYLADSGLYPTVSCLKSGHSEFTTSGNVSEHWSGNAVDISAINNIPILGNQDPGGIADQTVKRLMMLQGTMEPHQIISLIDHGANTLAMADHANHVHVGFRPLFGSNAKLGQQMQAILKPQQWTGLIQRLGQLDNPVVPTKPSKFAIPVKPSSNATNGE